MYTLNTGKKPRSQDYLYWPDEGNQPALFWWRAGSHIHGLDEPSGPRVSIRFERYRICRATAKC